MKQALAQEIEGLRDLTVAELRQRYQEVFGEATRSTHKRFLYKRVAWGMQAREHGGLSERARRRAEELARDSDLRLIAPARTVVGHFKPSHDRRLPMPGALITREYQGRTISVTVLDEGFEYDGTVYRSLTAVAKAVTGSHWNGYLFFAIAKGGSRR